MIRQKKFLWLGGVFDEKTINSFPSMSPASNFWQRGFIEALKMQGHNIHVIGHPVERVYPFGRLDVRASQASFPDTFTGNAVGYVNAPFLREAVQYVNYRRATRYHIKRKGLPDYVVTFSCLNKTSEWTATISAARSLRVLYGIPWICIVADGVAPLGADGYVYLTWAYFESTGSPSPKLHLDGGIPTINKIAEENSTNHPKALMYMGALTPHGGVTLLARALQKLPDRSIELWVCGRGENEELERLARIDERIKLIGFVSEEKLNELANSAYAFVNPRPSDFTPNKLNYPSKLLHYLAYAKPVISTWTEGLSPEYQDLLVQVVDETEDGLALTIQMVLNMTDVELQSISVKIEKFNESHEWPHQIGRFIFWLLNEL